MAAKKSFTASVAPFDEVFHDPEWTYVNRAQLQDCSKFFDADPNVVTGFNFRMDALLNGGIIFKRKGKSMQGHAKDWMSEQFSKFLKDVVRNRWFAGFAACAWEEDEEFVGRPVVLDLTQITVRYRLSIFGRASFRYFYQPRDGISAEVEIKNVMTFSWDPPDSAGNLRSLVLLLAQDHMHETLLSYYSVVAMKGRALPVMITERDKEVYDRENIRAPMARSPTEIAMGMLSNTRQEEATENPERSNVIIQHTEDYFNRTQPAMTDTILTNLASINHMPHFASHYQLAQGRKFTSAPLPEAPTDLLAFRIARLERACALMGVPLAMLTNSTSTGGKKMAEGENSNSFVLFENSQMSLKLELIRCAQTMFYNIYLKAHLQEYLETTKQKDWNTADAAASAEVVVEMPSMPDEGKLIDYYTAGFLKYEALKNYLSSKHGIAIDSFNEKPELTVEEANGHFVDPAPPVAKKAKK
jgi:hypothetical protein